MAGDICLAEITGQAFLRFWPVFRIRLCNK